MARSSSKKANREVRRGAKQEQRRLELVKSESPQEASPFHKQDKTPIVPRNENQALYWNAMMDKYLTVGVGDAGCGKAQPLYSKIKTPNGWSTMGNMKIGQEVIAQDGTTTKVTAIYPQGKTTVYRITFADGRFTECHPDHLWKIHGLSAPKTKIKGGNSKTDVRTIEEARENRWRVVDTKTLIELHNSPSKNNRLYIPLCGSEQNEDKKLPLDPYLLGVILGDGGITTTSITISKPYQQLFDKIQSLLPDWMECNWRNQVSFGIKRKVNCDGKNTVTQSLKGLDLLGLRSWEKFIPSEYFEGSTDQRLALLQGLLDTDGTVSSGKSISFSSSSKRLAEGVQYLVRSLGGIAKLSTRIPHFTHKGEYKEGRVDYRVHVRYPNPQELFTLDHKRERAIPTQYSKNLKLKITSIEQVDSVETQCITVEHEDHLYITDDFIVTHNTFLSTVHAANLLLNKEVERIVVTRPVLQADEDLGFLPGDIAEKFAPYFRPVQEVLRKRLGGSFLQYCLRPEIEKVVIAPFAYLRGLTFTDSIVILDEAQNTTVNQMKLFLTRIGEGSTVIVNGDVTQCDLPKGVKSGLADLLEKIEAQQLEDIEVVKFGVNDSVRGVVCSMALKLYS